MRPVAKFLLLLFIAFNSQAESKHFFNDKTLDLIRIEMTNKPFVLTFWSKDCVYCSDNFTIINSVKIRNSTIPVYAVCVDCIDDFDNFINNIKRYNITNFQNYLMDSVNNESIFFRIDSKWGGETPKTYFFDPKHLRTSFSGLIPKQSLNKLLENNN